MTDATEALADLRKWAARHHSEFGIDPPIVTEILAHIDAQAAEIERLRVERDTLKADSEMLVMYGKKIKALRAERDDILHRLDAAIAQANAALGSEG